MEKIKTLLIANRGEIAVRIIRTAKELKIKTISIYTKSDAASHHVRDADEAILLPGSDSTAYTDGDAILEIANFKKADAIIPGYGFLSEKPEFARACKDAGIGWVGPSAEVIEKFGIKHVARELAEEAGIPIVPGTKELVKDEEDAVKEADKIGYPVMLKLTGGGGGMGLLVCQDKDEVKAGFSQVTSRGEALYKNPGIFIEKYFSSSRHVEIQVFGNGKGDAIHFGERECSIQRRHQKVIEECPSPFITRYEGLREAIGGAAANLASSVNYASAGTVEYIVDDKTGAVAFLEMNTRLQVEHGITEMCYGVDLVELMLKQTDAELAGKGGLDGDYLKKLQEDHPGPTGSAIECRLYAENPVRDYAPSPGILQEVKWGGGSDRAVRVDTWVGKGTQISPNYDPLIAKIMYHSPHSRSDAIDGMQLLLQGSKVCGPPTNLDLLTAIVANVDFAGGRTLTSFLGNLEFMPPAIDVVNPGAYTLVMDYPGRPAVGKGICPSGVMDPVAFQIANFLVGNPKGTEGLEITLNGPELRFLQSAVISICGAPMDVSLEGSPIPMWTRIKISSNQKLKIRKTTGNGCRAYMAIHGGFTNVAEYFGSKSTSPIIALGGYQGRALAPGDLLGIVEETPEHLQKDMRLPATLIPEYPDQWEIMTMSGPHDEGFLTQDDLNMLYSTEWGVSHNASRSAIRLNGPVPQWARKDGGEGGSHPSNVVEWGYCQGILNWTGDDPCIFPNDCPNFGGFAASNTIIWAEFSKLGQMKAGDKVRYRQVSHDEAIAARKLVNDFLEEINSAVKTESFDSASKPLKTLSVKNDSTKQGNPDGIIERIQASDGQPLTRYRAGGDCNIIIEYGNEDFNLNYKCRGTDLQRRLFDSVDTHQSMKDAFVTSMCCCNSLTVQYDPTRLTRSDFISHLKSLESKIGDLSTIAIPTRRIKLPISFESAVQDAATKRYMETLRPHAPYLPNNLKFVAENNAFTTDRIKEIYTKGQLAAVAIGFFSGCAVSLPVDPRERMSSPKTNPSRVETPAGTVGWGGSCMALYPVTSPGGYQMTARTLPIFDQHCRLPDFPKVPWLFKDFDLMTFYQVEEKELDEIFEKWEAGKYRYEWEDVQFDMAEHNKLLRDTETEVKDIREKQAKAQEEMVRRENESLAKWREEKASQQVDEGTVDKLLQDKDIESVDAPVDANVWKVVVKEGQEVGSAAEIAILEAMKLEISVKLDGGDEGAQQKKRKVEKLLVRPGDMCKAGQKLALMRNL